MKTKKLIFQISVLALTLIIFLAFNLSMYFMLTRKLSNNFSGATQSKMIDVSLYLPHEEGSNLAKINSSLHLS